MHLLRFSNAIPLAFAFRRSTSLANMFVLYSSMNSTFGCSAPTNEGCTVCAVGCMISRLRSVDIAGSTSNSMLFSFSPMPKLRYSEGPLLLPASVGVMGGMGAALILSGVTRIFARSQSNHLAWSFGWCPRTTRGLTISRSSFRPPFRFCVRTVAWGLAARAAAVVCKFLHGLALQDATIRDALRW